MKLLIMGAPGAGKGTQASAIAKRYDIPAISTGDIFRKNIKDKTPLGIQISELIQAGEYVPDEITEKIVATRLGESDCVNGFLLDGFPRTVKQAKWIDQYLQQNNTALNAVVVLKVDQELLIKRLLKRAQLEGRADDTEEVIRHRMEVYISQTEPLLTHYQDAGLVVEVFGEGTVEEVRERIIRALDHFVRV